MLDFLDMISSARYLFAPNALPLTNLLMKSNMKALETLFSFQAVQVEAEPNQFRLTSIGMGGVNGLPVQQMAIDPISINLWVGGESSDLHNAYEVLREFLTGIDSKRRLEKPKLYAVTHQTQSVVKLSIPYERLIAPELATFLSVQKEKTLRQDGSASVEIILSNLSFQVKYAQSSDVYSLLPKTLTIEPRAGSDPKENMYFVLTPTTSDVHRALVEEFETEMSRGK